jgi:hypothetical protein
LADHAGASKDAKNIIQMRQRPIQSAGAFIYKRRTMNTEKFNEVVDANIAAIKSTLSTKADEYARGDRLSNFKKIAAFRNTTPEEALVGMVIKHIAALDDFVTDLDSGHVQQYPRWREKIGDIQNYMVLLDALVIERMERLDIKI